MLYFNQLPKKYPPNCRTKFQFSSPQITKHLTHSTLTQRSPHLRAELAKPTPHRPMQEISLPPSFSAEYVTNLYF